LTPREPLREGDEAGVLHRRRSAVEEDTVTVSRTQGVMERYFSLMTADEDFSRCFAEDVSWLMVDSGDLVSGREPVRDYLLRLHGRMRSGQQRPLVVTDGHAFLEGDAVNADEGDGRGLAYCLVYDITGDAISAMRCYGTLARLLVEPGPAAV
jgi:hypothetical protein